MKRIILVVVLVAIAGIAGIVLSNSKPGGGHWPSVILHDKQSAGDVREEIRETYELSPGARVAVSGINGAVTIETSDTNTADVHIERTGASQEVLSRRRVTVEGSSTALTIRVEKGDRSFLARIFGSKPSERVTLRLPRRISLVAKGVNGAVVVGEIEGSVECHGINGKVEIAQASGAEFNAINGNISVALNKLDKKGIDIHGINGNIELRLSAGVNADLDAHGMNGDVISDLSNVTVDKSGRGSYSARIGNGGNPISASGINGNIRLIPMVIASASSD